MKIFERLIILLIIFLSLISSYLCVNYHSSILYINALFWLDVGIVLNFISLFDKYKVIDKIYSIVLINIAVIFNYFILEDTIHNYPKITLANAIILLFLILMYTGMNSKYINVDKIENE